MKPIYLESDEEITSIIDKLTAAKEKKVAMVLPKNGALLQSLISLRLLAREAKTHHKEIIIITNSKVGQRLAGQVGLETRASLDGVDLTPEPVVASAPVAAKTTAPAPKPETLPGGIRVNQYLGERSADDVVPIEESAPAADSLETVAVAGGEAEAPATAEVTVASEPGPDVLPVEPMAVTTPSEHGSALPPIIPRHISIGGFDKPEFHVPWKAVAVASGLLVVAGLLVALFLPKATVKLTVPAESVSQTLALAVKTTNTNDDATVLAGTAVTVTKDVSAAVTATGKKDIGTKATGSIKITNKYKDANGAGKDQTFAAGTKATDTKTSKVFTLDKTVTVGKLTYNSSTGQPIYQTETVAVTAVEPGESYNIGVTTFTLPGALANTTAENSTAFTGGLTKTVAVLTQADVDGAVTAAKKQAEIDTAAELKTKAGDQEIVTGASWQTVTKQSLDQSVGAQVSSATLSLSLEVGALLFDQDQAKQRLDALLRKDLPDTKELVVPDDKPFSLAVTSLAADHTSLELKVSGDGFVVPRLEKKTIASVLAHRSVTQAKAKLASDYGATDSEITVTPSWWPQRLPFLAGAIVVEYGFNAVPGS